MSDEHVRRDFEAWHKEHSGISLMRHANGGYYVYAESEWQLWLSRQAEIDRLKSELEASKKDADRYRWLRMRDIDIFDNESCIEMPCGGGLHEELDAAIDKAMEAK